MSRETLCPNCNGRGKVNGYDGMTTVRLIDCQRCRGVGALLSTWDCVHCGAPQAADFYHYPCNECGDDNVCAGCANELDDGQPCPLVEVPEP